MRPPAHALDVATRAEGRAGARQQQAAHTLLVGEPREAAPQRGRERVRQRVASLRPVQREDQHAALESCQQLVRTGIDRPLRKTHDSAYPFSTQVEV